VLLWNVTACGGGGISSPEDYRQATQSFNVSKTSVLQRAREAREQGDPMLLNGRMERLQPAVNKMHAAAHKVEVDDDTLQALHNELLAAVDSYKNLLDRIAPSISNTPLGKSKVAMSEALESFNQAVAAWNSKLDAL
jgi:hypothetical protein